MSVDNLLFLNEKKKIILAENEFENAFSLSKGPLCKFCNFQKSKSIFVKIVRSKCDFGKIGGLRYNIENFQG